MPRLPLPSSLSSYYTASFNLKHHIQEFLHLDSEIVESRLETSQQQMAELGHKDFDWEQATAFYRDKVGEFYLFDLGAWHLASYEYIEDTLLLISNHAQGRVLDFGGGIGTHTLGTALCPQVEQVVYCDINPINRDFVKYRAEQMGLSQKIVFCQEIAANETFDTIISFDVLEHLPDPSQQLLKFHQALTNEGKIILNWCFFKGVNQEHPFHLDDPYLVDIFYRTLQSKFLEIYHPHQITSRCYRKLV
ncbi:methyltransferase domain-containing protein [Cuspidothrix issatschenkoi LEGE 03284]|uniref:class I SAM-dependent methyltransferase n=1 Tax=Cuspidothrix issatschenkoi TaxID=230752 RepID=UPI00187E6585|nr:methyltransferase domain-containing protein [Cuspidothrix issatschenkoi]MBE9233923.1 methyltransferase domain-containing protein [Cuspidothrix issatschenkoi LEGE 03284]